MKKILCFGDSNTWGHNPIDGSMLEKRWPVFVQNMLSECEIIQDGVCGRATKHNLPNEDETSGIKVFRQEYLSDKNEFDLIIIMLGTNDVLNCNNYTPEETAETLRIYVKESYEKFDEEKTKILLISPILLTDDCIRHPVFKELYSERSIERSRKFAEVIMNVAKIENVYFLDAAKVATASSVDGIHMEPEEHEKLAFAVVEKIKSILF